MKHTLLVVLLQQLNRKPSGWCYYDTHAGAGCYDLHSTEAQSTLEAQTGIAKLWPECSSAPDAVQRLCAVVAASNHSAAEGQMPRYYPGSPRIAQALAREQDRLVLAELHPQEQRLLRKQLQSDARVAIHARDGYEMLKALVPPVERRGLVLMDPPFEQLDEFALQLQALRDAYARWSTGVYALWYPIKDEALVNRFYRNAADSGIQKVLVAEFRTARSAAALFSACGMLVVNPPWQSQKLIAEALRYLTSVLATGSGSSRVYWLVPEGK